MQFQGLSEFRQHGNLRAVGSLRADLAKRERAHRVAGRDDAYPEIVLPSVLIFFQLRLNLLQNLICHWLVLS